MSSRPAASAAPFARPPGVDRFALRLALIACGAVALRLPFLEARSFWFDELFTRYWIELPQAFLWGEGRRIETNPPLYFSALRLWAGLVGTADWALRLPSTVASAAAVVVCGLLGRLAFGTTAGLLAALFYAVAPMSYWFAHEARPTAFLPLVQGLGLLACLGFLNAARRAGGAAAIGRQQRAGLWLLFVAASLLGIHLHATGVLFVAASCAVMGLMAVADRRGLGWPALLFWVTAGLAVLVLSAPQLLIFLAQRELPSVQWVPRLSFATAEAALSSTGRLAVAFAVAPLAGFREHSVEGWPWSTPFWLFLAAVKALAVLAGLCSVRSRPAVALVAITAGFAGLAIAVSLAGQSLVSPRFFVTLALVYAVLAGGGLAALRPLTLRVAAPAALLLPSIVLLVAGLVRDPGKSFFTVGLADYRPFVHALDANPACAGRLVSHAFHLTIGWPHYGRAGAPRSILVAEDWAAPQPANRHQFWPRLEPVLGQAAISLETLAKLVADKQPMVVLVETIHPAMRPPPAYREVVEALRRSRPYQRATFPFGNGHVEAFCFGHPLS